MILWVLFAVLVAAVTAVIARPMLLEADAAQVDSAQAADLAVYKDQLAEIEADLERGLINSDEAQSARAELGRRLIKRAEAGDGEAGDSAGPIKDRSSLRMAYATALAVPLLSLAVYLGVGSPTLPGMPHAARLQTPPANAGVLELVAKVEEQLRKTPEDGRGWDALAPVYLRLGRYTEAAQAFAQAMRLQGETQRRLSGFAEAAVRANNGIVVEPARKAYTRLLSLEPGNSEAQFWLAVADEQDGKTEAARDAFQKMLSGAPEDAPWKPIVVERLAALDAALGGVGAEGAPQTSENAALPVGPSRDAEKPVPGPTPEDVAASAELSAEERQGFINSMVERLAQRLEDNPEDFDGWLRLVRAYAVLGRKDDATAAVSKARQSAAQDSDKLVRLEKLVVEFGLGS